MPVPTLILFVLAVIATVLMAVGWAQDPAAPTPWEWFLAKLTEGGLWTGLVLSLVVVACLAWRDGRRGGKSDGPG